MLKFNKKLGIVLGILALIVATSFLGIHYYSIEKELNTLQKENQAVIKEISQERALYIIDNGSDDIKAYQVLPSRASTVFSLLEEIATGENFKIESKTYQEMGVFVESIDGVKNGTDNKYWQYWVNGELPMVAADKKEAKGGDRVEWKFAPAEF